MPDTNAMVAALGAVVLSYYNQYRAMFGGPKVALDKGALEAAREAYNAKRAKVVAEHPAPTDVLTTVESAILEALEFDRRVATSIVESLRDVLALCERQTELQIGKRPAATSGQVVNATHEEASKTSGVLLATLKAFVDAGGDAESLGIRVVNTTRDADAKRGAGLTITTYPDCVLPKRGATYKGGGSNAPSSLTTLQRTFHVDGVSYVNARQLQLALAKPGSIPSLESIRDALATLTTDNSVKVNGRTVTMTVAKTVK